MSSERKRSKIRKFVRLRIESHCLFYLIKCPPFKREENLPLFIERSFCFLLLFYSLVGDWGPTHEQTDSNTLFSYTLFCSTVTFFTFFFDFFSLFLYNFFYCFTCLNTYFPMGPPWWTAGSCTHQACVHIDLDHPSNGAAKNPKISRRSICSNPIQMWFHHCKIKSCKHWILLVALFPCVWHS